MKKALAYAFVLLLVAFLGWIGMKVKAAFDAEGNARGRRGAVVVPVELAPVKKTDLRDIGRFTGSLVPASRFIVAPRVAGRLVRLLVNLGDPVKNGQLIAELDDQEYVQQLERAKADLVVAKATVEESKSNLDNAKREFDRIDALLAKKIASEAEYDKAKANLEVQEARYRVATAQVDQKKAAEKEAEIRLSYTKIHATFEDGSETRAVGERFVDEGALLAENTPIVSVLDIHYLLAAVYVIERDYSRIAIGQKATVTTDAWTGRTFEGRILRIAPQLEETSRQARVEIRIPNRDGALKPGMFVRVEIEFARHSNATTVPVSALTRRNGKTGIFVASTDRKKAHFVPVTTGIRTSEIVEVLEPEVKGSVVVTGQHLLEEGSAIVVADESDPAPGTSTEPAERVR